MSLSYTCKTKQSTAHIYITEESSTYRHTELHFPGFNHISRTFLWEGCFPTPSVKSGAFLTSKDAAYFRCTKKEQGWTLGKKRHETKNLLAETQTILFFSKRKGKIAILPPLLDFTQWIEHHQHEPDHNSIARMFPRLMCLTTFATDFSPKESNNANSSSYGLGNSSLALNPLEGGFKWILFSLVSCSNQFNPKTHGKWISVSSKFQMMLWVLQALYHKISSCFNTTQNV